MPGGGGSRKKCSTASGHDMNHGISDRGYRLEKAGVCCSECGSEFGAGEAYISVLKEGDEELFIREDFCRRCWAGWEDPYFSFWQTRRRSGSTERKPDEEDLLPFYRSLSGKQDRNALELKYVLSLYLTRKKVLKLVDVEQDTGGEVLVFEGPGKEEKALIRDPGLSEDRIAELTETICSLFPGWT